MARAYTDEDPEETEQMALAQVCFFKYIVIITRLFGILTFVTLMAVGIHTIVVYEEAENPNVNTTAVTPNAYEGPRNLDIGIYIVCAAVVVFIYETSWIAFRILSCCQTKNFCHYFCIFILWFDHYKRGILYFAMALPCFLQGIELPLGILCGFMLVTTAMLYVAKTYKKFGEEYAMHQLTGHEASKTVTAEPETNEYTKLLEQKSLSEVGTQTSEPHSEEEEGEDEKDAASVEGNDAGAAEGDEVKRPPPRPADSPFASITSLGRKKKEKKEEGDKPIEVTFETDLEGGNPFGNDDGFD